MAETRYAYALPDRDESLLHAQVAALSPPLPGFLGVCGSGGPQAEAVFSGPLSAADRLRLDAVVAAHRPPTPAERAAAARAAKREKARRMVSATSESATVLVVRAYVLALCQELRGGPAADALYAKCQANADDALAASRVDDTEVP